MPILTVSLTNLDVNGTRKKKNTKEIACVQHNIHYFGNVGQTKKIEQIIEQFKKT